MALKLKADTLEALDNWRAGKALRTIELGHIHRTEEHPGMSATINTAIHVARDQERAHEYCFAILAHYVEQGEAPGDYEAFLVDSAEVAGRFEGLTGEEKIGAESLAWKALVVGWRKAIDGHKDVEYVEVTRAGVAS